MKTKRFVFILSALISASCVPFYEGNETQNVYDIEKGRKVVLDESLSDWKEKRLIIVGEQHDNRSHHLGQLKIIQALQESGMKVAVGLEMFRADSQTSLDQWINGEMSLADFQKVYYDNWNFPWSMYGMILEYAKDNGIPLVGLNVPREITRRVAYSGFESLSDKQKGKLSDVVCDVDDNYLNFIKEVYGSHAHGHMNFNHFCEAQLVWDSVMAIRSVDYLKDNPERIMVLLTGNGHARKRGVPIQVWKRSDVSLVVVLPEISGVLEPGRISSADADYLLLDLD